LYFVGLLVIIQEPRETSKEPHAAREQGIGHPWYIRAMVQLRAGLRGGGATAATGAIAPGPLI